MNVTLINNNSELEAIVWFKKISIPLPKRRNLKFQRGGESGQRPRNFQRGGSFHTGSIITIVMFNFNLLSAF